MLQKESSTPQTHADCRKHQTMALLHNTSISLTLATNSNHQMISSSSIQPEIPQALLLLGCHGELFEVEDDVSKVMHPEAICGGAVALPSIPGSLLHTPVRVSLQHTHFVTIITWGCCRTVKEAVIWS